MHNDDHAGLIEKGLKLYDALKYNESLPYLEKAYNIAPGCMSAMYNYANVLHMLGRDKKAYGILIKLIDKSTEKSKRDCGHFDNAKGVIVDAYFLMFYVLIHGKGYCKEAFVYADKHLKSRARGLNSNWTKAQVQSEIKLYNKKWSELENNNNDWKRFQKTTAKQSCVTPKDYFYIINANSVRSGLRVKGNRGHPEVHGAILRFASWLRRNYSFPIRVPIYLLPGKTLRTIHGDDVVASFFAPFDRTEEPYIRIATGDYPELLAERGRNVALAFFLDNCAHEVVHYQQWIASGANTERGVEVRARGIVDRYAFEVDRP